MKNKHFKFNIFNTNLIFYLLLIILFIILFNYKLLEGMKDDDNKKYGPQGVGDADSDKLNDQAEKTQNNHKNVSGDSEKQQENTITNIDNLVNSTNSS